MKTKEHKERMVTRSFTGISVCKNGTDSRIFFPGMRMSQVEAISSAFDIDMSTAKEDIKKYSLPEAEFLKLATME